MQMLHFAAQSIEFFLWFTEKRATEIWATR